MSVWVLIWLCLSGALLYFMGWTLFILYRQKKVWKAFANRHALRYKAATMTAPPEISGVFDGYTISLFTGEHIAPDIRKTRKMIAMEIKLPDVLPAGGGVASGDMVPFLQQMNFKAECRPGHPDWDKGWIAMSDHTGVLQDYLSVPRLEALMGLMRLKGASAILVFRGDVALLRLDRPDPLDKLPKIEALVRKMTAAARVLDFHPGESASLKALALKNPPKEIVVPVSAGKVKTDLRLEEEGEDSP